MVTGEELKMHALHFHSLGLNVSCVSNIKTQYNFLENDLLKAPMHDWKHLQEGRQEIDELLSYNWSVATAIGVVLGYENLMALDIDGCVSVDFVFFICKILKLPEDYSWIYRSGSGCGYQIVFYCKNTQPNKLSESNSALYKFIRGGEEFGEISVNSYYIKKHISLGYLISEYLYDTVKSSPVIDTTFDGIFTHHHFIQSADKIEFKWQGHCVIPPSIHRTGLEYAFLNSVPKELPREVSIEDVYILRNILCSQKSFDSPTEIISKYTVPNDVKCKYIVVDTETNGLATSNIDTTKTKWPELIQIAWISYDERNNYLRRKAFSIKPNGFKLNIDAIRYHGLTLDKLNIIGEDVKIVLYNFLEDIKNCEIIVGHNVDFDLNVIKSELIRNGMDVEWFDKKKRFCTMKNDYSISLMNGSGIAGDKYPKLVDLFNVLYKTNLVPVHSAMHDVVVTHNCYLKVKDHSDTYIRSKDKNMDIEHPLNVSDIDDFIDPFDAAFYEDDDLPF
jgi:DNA polymerase III epsilon subunit-like protein